MKKWQFGKGIITETKQGTFSVDLSICGKRKRKVFKNLSDSKAWILSSGGDVTPISADALRARELLPQNITLLEAVQFWISKHKGHVLTPISVAYDAFIRTIYKSIRSRTLGGYRQAITRLADYLGDVYVNDLTKDNVSSILNDLTPTARNNIISRLSPFFSFCIDEGWLAENPCKKIRRAKKVSAPPAIFSPSETKTFLDYVVKKSTLAVPVFALGFFAGLRPEEALRIRPSDISNGFIVLSAEKTKTTSARIVKIRPNLAAWLSLYPVTQSHHPQIVRSVRRAFVKDGGIWYQDVARHSYATYAYEQRKDARVVASEMGHTSTAVFFKHYRAMASAGSGDEYFSIMP